jgi:tol-pal system protein YbgF
MIRKTIFAPVVLLATGACVATKGDIRLLQDEMRATRSMIARADSTALQREQIRRAEAEVTAASIARAADSLRVLSQRLANFQSLTSGQIDQIANDLIRTQALLGQSTRALQEMRAQYEALRDAAPAATPAPVPVSVTDTTQRTAAATPATPGPATLLLTGRNQMSSRSYRTARMTFEQLLSSYPNAEEAAAAQQFVGEAFEAERNQPAADSVYQLVVGRYPRSPYAPTALYKRGKMLWDANKKVEARPILQRIRTEYPSSDEARLAKDLLDGR